MLANAHTHLLFLLLALQVNDEHGLREGDECDGEAGEDPGAKLRWFYFFEIYFTKESYIAEKNMS